MKQNHFEISSEQTLQLEELRKILAKALPDAAADTIELPVAYYGGCGAVCMPGCSGSCVNSCGNDCDSNCKGGCSSCTGCFGSCQYSCVVYLD